MNALQLALLLSALWLGYVLVLYPLAMCLIGLVHRFRAPEGSLHPSITVIVASCASDAAIRRKLDATLTLDYPPDLFDVVVALDGDGACGPDDACFGYEHPRVAVCGSRRAHGKNPSLDAAVARAKGEILVFTDTATILDPDALRRLAAGFADPRVGCIGGFIRFGEQTEAAPRAFELYKRLEERIRNGSNVLGYVPSVAGAVHAIRREIYRPTESHFTRDVVDPAQAIGLGYRVVRDPRVGCRDVPWVSLSEVFRARVRVTMRGVAAIPYVIRQLRRARSPLPLLQFVSHKVLRWWIWLPATVAFATSGAMATDDPVVRSAFLAESAVLAIAATGSVASLLGARLPVAGVLGFYLVNLGAMGMGCLKALVGQRAAVWQPAREEAT